MRLYLKTRKDRLKFRLRTRLQVRANSQTKGLEQGWKQRATPGRDVQNCFFLLSLSFSLSPHTCETLTLFLRCAKPILGKNRLSSDIRNHPRPPPPPPPSPTAKGQRGLVNANLTCVSPSRAPVLSCAHYFRAPSTQANVKLVHRVLSYPTPGNEIASFQASALRD